METHKMQFEVFKGGFIRRRWYWRLRSSNGEIVAQSQGYVERQTALDTINSIREHAQNAFLYDIY